MQATDYRERQAAHSKADVPVATSSTIKLSRSAADAITLPQIQDVPRMKWDRKPRTKAKAKPRAYPSSPQTTHAERISGRWVKLTPPDGE